jgi:hypothetical protein
MDTSALPAAADRFWTAFTERVAPLRATFEEAPEAVFEAVEEALHAEGFDLAFDVTVEADGAALLVLSPEGDAEAARLIDALVARAPALPGWRVTGRRPRADDWSDALAIVGSIADVDLSDARFLVREDQVEMVAAALAEFEPQDARTVVMLTLHHLLGEAYVMKSVRGFAARAEPREDATYLSAADLARLTQKG